MEALDSYRERMFTWHARLVVVAVSTAFLFGSAELCSGFVETRLGLAVEAVIGCLLIPAALLASGCFALATWWFLYRFARAAAGRRYALGQLLLSVVSPLGVLFFPLLVDSDVAKGVAHWRCTTAPSFVLVILDAVFVLCLLPFFVVLSFSLVSFWPGRVASLVAAVTLWVLFYSGCRWVVARILRP